MYAGGMPMTVADADRIRTLDGERSVLADARETMRDELVTEKDGARAAQEAKEQSGLDASEAGYALQDTGEEYGTKKEDFQQARSDMNAEKSEARGRQNATEGAEDALQADQNRQTQFDREQVNPIRDQIKQTAEFLQLQFWNWARKLFNEEEQAKLQAIYKNQLDAGKILVSAFAAFTNMNAAVMGVSKIAGSSGIFEATPLNPVARVEDDWVETEQRLKGLHDDLAAKEARLAEMQNDPYYRDELVEKQAEEAKAVAAQGTEQAKMDAAKIAMDGSKEERDDARLGYRSAQEAEQAASGPIRDYERRMTEIQNRMAKSEDEDKEKYAEQLGIRDRASI